MGIDLKAGGRIKVHKRTSVKGDDPYLKLLVKLYKFLARRTESNFNKVIANRLCMTKVQKAPMSIAKLAEHMKVVFLQEQVVSGTLSSTTRDTPGQLCRDNISRHYILVRLNISRACTDLY